MTGKGTGAVRRCLWVLAALILLALPACGGKEPEASVEGILVYQHGSTFYFYSKSDYEPILTLAGDVTTSGGELAVGRKVRVNFNGSVLEIAPPRFDKVYSVEVLGAAEEKEFQEGLDYFNTEVKPWHIDGLGAGSPEDPEVTEGILVYESAREDHSTFYLYTGDEYNKVIMLSGDDSASGGELAVGQKVRVNHDGMLERMAPPSFTAVYSIDILGEATEEEFQGALDYFNAEVKPWHIDGVTG